MKKWIWWATFMLGLQLCSIISWMYLFRLLTIFFLNIWQDRKLWHLWNSFLFIIKLLRLLKMECFVLPWSETQKLHFFPDTHFYYILVVGCNRIEFLTRFKWQNGNICEFSSIIDLKLENLLLFYMAKLLGPHLLITLYNN